MLVFAKENLVILSVPKTGTTALHAALRDRADIVISDPPALKHAPLYRYNRFLRPMLLQVCQQDPDIMTVMREPVSWLGSWYRYRRRAFLHSTPNSTQGISFDAFVDAYCRGTPPGFAIVGSQAKFLAPTANRCAVRYLFRYEAQDEIRAFLEARLVTSIQTDLLNVSPEHPLDLTAKTDRKLRRKCAAEFDLYAWIPA